MVERENGLMRQEMSKSSCRWKWRIHMPWSRRGNSAMWKTADRLTAMWTNPYIYVLSETFLIPSHLLFSTSFHLFISTQALCTPAIWLSNSWIFWIFVLCFWHWKVSMFLHASWLKCKPYLCNCFWVSIECTLSKNRICYAFQEPLITQSHSATRNYI